jgi:uncharacterized membrane protein
MHQKKVYECVERFKTVHVDACCVLLSTVTRVKVIEQIGQRIRDNRNISIDEILSEINASHESTGMPQKYRLF